MTTIAHIISGAYIGVAAAHVAPSEMGYILVALVSGAILDLDHLYYIVKDWKYFKKKGLVGNLHKARSLLHEMVGVLLVSAIMFVCAFINLKLALVIGIPALIHITEDLIVGKSTPLAPFDQSEMQIVRLNMRQKISIDIGIIIFFSILWIRYLNVA